MAQDVARRNRVFLQTQRLDAQEISVTEYIGVIVCHMSMISYRQFLLRKWKYVPVIICIFV